MPTDVTVLRSGRWVSGPPASVVGYERWPIKFTARQIAIVNHFTHG